MNSQKSKIEQRYFTEFKNSRNRRPSANKLYFCADYSSYTSVPIKLIYEFMLELEGSDPELEKTLERYLKDSVH